MTEPIAPLTHPECDCRNLDGFLLNVEKLLASELWALSTGEEFKTAVALWARAWKQVPAASLPNNERVLASFAGLPMARWKKVRDMAMRGFVLCNDGRLYHETLAEEARKAWLAKQRKASERDADARRLREWRKRRGNDDETPPETPSETGYETGTKAVRSEGKLKEGKDSSEAKASGAEAPDVLKFPANAPKPEDVVFGVGIKLLLSQGVSRETAASFLGRLNKDFGADLVAQVVVAAMAENPGDAKSWIVAACRKRAGKAGSDPPSERFTGPW